jgi:hypothetical protein
MPNVDKPNGFRPFRRIDGGTPGRFGYDYTIADALAANIGYGNLVSRTGTGKNITNAVDGVAGATVVGVFLGVKYRDVRGNIVYAPNWISGTSTFGAEGAKAVVVDDPKVVFIAQMSAGFVAADSGQFAGIVIAAPDNLGISTWEVNSADISGTLDSVKILGLANIPRNDYGTNAKVEVLIAFHEYGDGTLRAS